VGIRRASVVFESYVAPDSQTRLVFFERGVATWALHVAKLAR
jgi:hypothetical protein